MFIYVTSTDATMALDYWLPESYSNQCNGFYQFMASLLRLNDQTWFPIILRLGYISNNQPQKMYSRAEMKLYTITIADIAARVAFLIKLF